VHHDDAQWESWSRLMVRVQAGDETAYRVLLDEIGPVLYAFTRKRVFNPSLVDDVYQEVLMTFHKARHAYEPSRPFGPWLFTVARNSLLDALGKNRKFVERELPTENLPDRAKEPEDLGLDDGLLMALRSLPEANRRAVVLLKIKGYSLEEAAREIGITVSAIKVRAHRGYVQLRRKLLEKETK